MLTKTNESEMMDCIKLLRIKRLQIFPLLCLNYHDMYTFYTYFLKKDFC